jgi:hypothetical protein
MSKFSVLRRLLVVFCFFALLIWVYVVAFQIADPESPYWPVAVWLPIRMDYFGETGFIAAFICAILAAVIWDRGRCGA